MARKYWNDTANISRRRIEEVEEEEAEEEKMEEEEATIATIAGSSAVISAFRIINGSERSDEIADLTHSRVFHGVCAAGRYSARIGVTIRRSRYVDL